MTFPALLVSLGAGDLLARVEHPTSNIMAIFRGVVCTLCALEAVICGYFSITLYRTRKAQLARSQQIQGEVVEFRKRSSSDGDMLYPVVRFRAPGGEEIAFESTLGMSHWRIEPGAKVNVLYDPQLPEKPELLMFGVAWLIPVILASASIGGVVGFWMFYTMIG